MLEVAVFFFAHAEELCGGSSALGIANVAALVLNFAMHAGGLVALFYFIKGKVFPNTCMCVGGCSCGKSKKIKREENV